MAALLTSLKAGEKQSQAAGPTDTSTPLTSRMLVRGVDVSVGLVSHQDEPYLLLGCSVKKRTISLEASGPCGSVKDPLRLPPDQA